jgi:uncharacterized protein involved in cysteine biosynthesis
LLVGGRTAFRTVPRLRGFMLRGFLLNLAVFGVLAAVVMGLLYQFAVQPLSAQITQATAGEGLVAGLITGVLNALLWLTQALLLAASLVFSFLVALALMSLWFEALAGRIVAHFRGPGAEEAAPRFSLGAWLAGIGRSLKASLGLLLLSLLSVGLGFVPVAGPLLVIAINAYLLGWEVREPYLVVREGLGDDPRALRRGLRLWTARAGLVPLVLAFIPWIGWVLLPAAMITLVAGVAWEGERALQAQPDPNG